MRDQVDEQGQPGKGDDQSLGNLRSSRRSILKGMLVSGGVVGLAGEARALPAGNASGSADSKSGPLRFPANGAAEFAAAEPGGLTVQHPQSDVMVDVLKSLNIRYMAQNPGSSFRGLHESIINYGKNDTPELITCLHEETSVAMAAGYARVTGYPMAVLMHSVVGLQHGSMSIYHAFADRTPVLMFVGTALDAAQRRPFIEWLHSAQDQAEMVRDFTKWDDQPQSIQHFAESTVRAVKVATELPMGPALISIDMELQERPFKPSPSFAIPRLTQATPPAPNAAALREVAEALISAEAPLILAHRYARTDKGLPRLVELAEQLHAPVVDSGDRFNFPTDHPYNHSQRLRTLVPKADVIVALEPVDLWGSLNRQIDQVDHPTRHIAGPGAKIFTIGTGDAPVRSNLQDFQRYAGVDISIDADAEDAVPLLIAELKRLATDSWSVKAEQRGAALKEIFATLRERNLADARVGWDASPIATGRLFSELWDLIRNEDWVLASQTTLFQSNWPLRIWNINKPGQIIGGIGAGGMGSNVGTSTGVALAYRGSGKIVINVQGDGDLMYAPGALWTAAHHRIPILHIVHNNRAYHQEVMHVQKMADRRERGIDRAHIGTTIDDPNLNFAKLAESMGVWAPPPVSDPNHLRTALRRAIAVVKGGAPALVEIVSQPR